MKSRKFSRRDFLGKTTAGLAGAAVIPGVLKANEQTGQNTNPSKYDYSNSPFAAEVEKLPIEKPYDYHKKLSTGPVHVLRRNMDIIPEKNALVIPDKGWEIKWVKDSGIILENAVKDFCDYLDVSQNVKIETESVNSLNNWKRQKKCIVAGTKEQLPGCGDELKKPKDYKILVKPNCIIVCGFDERGTMFGLYNIEARMNLAEAPVLPENLNIVRHSLYNNRMVLSWMGWMEWPDNLLSHLAHDGFDAIFASVYTNPNGDRTTAETSADFYARLLYGVKKQDPANMRDLINRASRYGIKVYAPIIWQYLGTKESEEGLRKLVREIVSEFPEIRGYILLTEGFWYKKWGGGHTASKEYKMNWAEEWSKAVGMVQEECHKIDPSIEILPWEYNIDFRASNRDVKRYFIKQLPDKTIPMLTWENGKSFELDGLKGHLRDYSLNQVGPAEVTDAQIDEANKRDMKVYSKVDTFASWQFGTIPYLPCPYQWFKRYVALEEYGVKGTLESWSNGYKPNFMSEIRAWKCWSNSPTQDEIFKAAASRMFGPEQSGQVIAAWKHFSRAIELMPDTGPYMGTNGAIGCPLFFQLPPARTATFYHSWNNPPKYPILNPYWPFTDERMVFFPDFSNKTNKAELYSRSVSGVDVGPETKFLTIFLKYLKRAIDEMEEGLKLYREAALKCSEFKREQAIREVVVAEQMQRMMQSDYALLHFEDLRLEWERKKDKPLAGAILDEMEQILRGEIDRTELSLLAATRDSRLGFQFEQDYVYTPYSLKEKLDLMRETLNVHLPLARKSKT